VRGGPILNRALVGQGGGASPDRTHGRAEKAGKAIADDAKGRLGHYQDGWSPLKPETIARKATGDTPLFETGRLRDSISYEVQPVSHDKVKVTVGSPEP